MTQLLALWPALVLAVVAPSAGAAVGLIVGSVLDLRDEARACIPSDTGADTIRG